MAHLYSGLCSTWSCAWWPHVYSGLCSTEAAHNGPYSRLCSTWSCQGILDSANNCSWVFWTIWYLKLYGPHGYSQLFNTWVVHDGVMDIWTMLYLKLCMVAPWVSGLCCTWSCEWWLHGYLDYAVPEAVHDGPMGILNYAGIVPLQGFLQLFDDQVLLLTVHLNRIIMLQL